MNQEDMNTIDSREELDKLIKGGEELLGTKARAITLFNEFMIVLNSGEYTKGEIVRILYTAKRFIENTLDNIVLESGIRVRADKVSK